jgi:hypothetical protein
MAEIIPIDNPTEIQALRKNFAAHITESWSKTIDGYFETGDW